MQKAIIFKSITVLAVGLFSFAGTALADGEWTTISGTSNVFNTNLGRVGIGTASPQAALHVDTSTLPIKYRRTGGGGSGSLNIDNVMFGSGGDMLYKPIPDSGNGAGHAFYVNDGSADLFALGITRYGNIGIGTTSPGAKLTINKNAVALPAPLTGTVVHIGQADATLNFLLLDAFGIGNAVVGRRANNTNASPSALLNGQGFFNMLGYGYGATGYSSGPRAQIMFFTAQDWTDTAQGTLISFKVTPNNSTALTEAMRIDNAGNVGIGSTNPLRKLTVAGIAETGGVSDAGSKASTILVSSTSGQPNDGGIIEFGAGCGAWAQPYFAAIKGLVTNGTANTTGDLAFYTRNSTSDTSLTERVRILANGNVGIGITNPYANFEIKAKAENNELLFYLKNFVGTGYYLGVSNAATGHRFFIGGNGGKALTIDPLSNVGIGTSNPQSTLAVNGTITTKKIKVTETGWSDFVFNEGYKLPTLAAVESHIKQYKHLPGIPSAREIRKKGLDVSDVLAKQMQKIEELTLYMIEMKKENQDLKNRLNALEKQVIQN